MKTQLEKVSNDIINAEMRLQEEIIPRAELFLERDDLKYLKERASKLEELVDQSKKPPTFSILFLGDSQNGKSTLINVLIGKKVLPEGTVGHCSTTVVRCRYKDQDNISVTLKYITEDKFLKDLGEKADIARMALEEENDPAKQREIVTKELRRFIDLFEIGKKGLNTTEIIEHCMEKGTDFPERTLLGTTKTLDSKPDNQNEIAENLSARGRKSFIVDECLIEGRFPNWHPSMELVDMPGTNADSWDDQVTSRMQTEVDGLALVTAGTQLTGSVMDWFKETSILSEIVGSSERNQTRVFVIKTKVDKLELQDDSDISKWEATQSYCSNIREHLITQINDLIENRFSRANELEILNRFVKQLPIHFVSSKIFRNLANPALKNRVLKNRMDNMDLYAAFKRFDIEEKNTGIPRLQQVFFEKTEDFVHSHYLKKLELDFQKEADRVVQFFRDKRMGIEQGMEQKGKAVHEAEQFISQKIPQEVAEKRKFLEDQIADLKDDFNQEIGRLLDNIVKNYDQQTRVQLNNWVSLPWQSVRAIGRKGGCHVTGKGYEIDLNGALAEFCLKALNSTWIDYRTDIWKRPFDNLRIQFLPSLENILAQAKGINDSGKISLIENTYGRAVSLARNELDIQIEKYHGETEQFDAIRPALINSIRNFLMPTYENIAAEKGNGSAARMRNHMENGVLNSIQEIRNIVRKRVELNWQGLTNSLEERLEEFFNLIESNFSEQSERLSKAAQTPQDKQAELLNRFNEMERLAEELVPQKER